LQQPLVEDPSSPYNPSQTPKIYNAPTASSWILQIVKLLVVLLLFVAFIALVILVVTFVSQKQFMKKKVRLNIHVALSSACTEQVLAINHNLTVYDTPNHQKIEFIDKYEPHLTLYLTDFQYHQLAHIKTQLVELASLNRTDGGIADSCIVHLLPNVNVSGQYIMWEAEVESCLQHMSDAIVNRTSRYVDSSAKSTIPDWLKSQPEDVRILKTEMIRKYGSPNVFSQFDPHVTVGYSTTKNQTVLENLVAQHVQAYKPQCKFKVTRLKVGSTGLYGTVLQDEDYIQINLKG